MHINNNIAYTAAIQTAIGVSTDGQEKKVTPSLLGGNSAQAIEEI